MRLTVTTGRGAWSWTAGRRGFFGAILLSTQTMNRRSTVTPGVTARCHCSSQFLACHSSEIFVQRISLVTSDQLAPYSWFVTNYHIEKQYYSGGESFTVEYWILYAVEEMSRGIRKWRQVAVGTYDSVLVAKRLMEGCEASGLDEVREAS